MGGGYALPSLLHQPQLQPEVVPRVLQSQDVLWLVLEPGLGENV